MNYYNICLDVGNVLCDVTFEPLIHAMRNVTDKDGVMFFLEKIQPAQDVALTTMSLELRHWFGLKGDDAKKILMAWNDCIVPNVISIEYLDLFIKLGVNVAILSNMGKDHRAIIDQKIGASLKRCDCYFSCDVGLRKPTMEYYASFLRQFPRYRESIYVDDRQDNIYAASLHYFKTEHIDTTIVSQKELKKLWENIHSA